MRVSTNDKDIRDDLAELKESVTAMNEDIRELKKEVKEVHEQLKVLSRLIVPLGAAIERL
jgi:peptidoglycan hydrolase CwlO-like protein